MRLKGIHVYNILHVLPSTQVMGAYPEVLSLRIASNGGSQSRKAPSPR